MASLDDLEAEATVVKEGEVYEGEIEDTIHDDILDAMSLLSKCMRLLDYVSDVDLCKSVTKRERESMIHVANKVREFLDGAETLYEDDGG